MLWSTKYHRICGTDLYAYVSNKDEDQAAHLVAV